ncbi:glycosyl hydrolase [Reticulomyxa filosa]|uniref:Glycosyl hydrolase n=1 Tax=Reticulomyxa filosa TaxID=46433 RepID=X6MNE8_RETFI|nr:glycosyl hydrolase [Reticulomyxa filosa]|eukprot:ETO15196.1 glycosyl hydrolase [Reticulomyxa filosa]
MKGSNTTDLAISFIDWNPYAPDSSMGLWQEVELTELQGGQSAYVTIANPLVNSTVNRQSNSAILRVMCEVSNYDDTSGMVVEETLCASIIDPNTNEEIAQQCQNISIPSGTYNAKVFFAPPMAVENVRLWWPYHMGTPYLYVLRFFFATTPDNILLESKFGIRQVESKLITAYQYTLFQVNGVDMIVLGGGYAPDLLLQFEQNARDNDTFIRRQLQYVQWMGLNTIRMEGNFQNEHFYQLCDELGILVMPGLPCCDSWQHWSDWTSQTYSVAQE